MIIIIISSSSSSSSIYVIKMPTTKNTTEYSFELFLSISRHLIFYSQVLNFTSVELNGFAKQAKLLKKTSGFFKSDGSHAISF